MQIAPEPIVKVHVLPSTDAESITYLNLIQLFFLGF